MEAIKMVDLYGQYVKIKIEIDDAIQKVLQSTAFIRGPEVSSFQNDLQNYTGSKHVIACGNGTDAIQIALMALGLQPGDEVITTSFTFIATVEVISLLKLKPVFVDIDPNTFNIDTTLIEKKITKKTKAILPVHLFGLTANMENILQIAKNHNLFVIEDNAQAIGGDYTFSNGTIKKSGTIGDIGCTSFFPSKNLGAFGDGGAILTDNNELADRIKTLSNHGMKVKYYHDYIGVNSRLDTLQATILRIKLKYLDDYIKARQKAAEYYNNTFKSHSEIQIPLQSKSSTHVFHQYTLTLKDTNREKLQEYLSDKKIPSMIYYPIPLHLQKAYKYLEYKKGDLPITEDIANRVISLPMHTELSIEQLEYITSSFLSFFES